MPGLRFRRPAANGLPILLKFCHGRDETDLVGGLNLTHRFGGVLPDGGPDAENGGSDGVGDITAAWREHSGFDADDGLVAKYGSAVFA